MQRHATHVILLYKAAVDSMHKEKKERKEKKKKMHKAQLWHGAHTAVCDASLVPVQAGLLDAYACWWCERKAGGAEYKTAVSCQMETSDTRQAIPRATELTCTRPLHLQDHERPRWRHLLQ